MAVAGLAVFWLRHTFVLPPGLYVMAILLGIVFYQVAAQALDCYGRLDTGPALTRFVGALFIAAAALIGAAFFAKVSEDFSRLWVLGWLLVTAIIGIGVRCALFYKTAGDMARGVYHPRILLIADSPPSEAALAVVDVVQRLTPRDAVEQLPALLENPAYDEIVMIPPLGDSADRLFALARMSPTRVRVQLDPVFAETTAHRIDQFGELPTLDIVPPPLSRTSQLVKRLEDIFIGMLLFLLALPILAVAAAAIRLEDGGPVIFRQPRRGEKGQVFNLLKLRTMRVSTGPDGHMPQTARGDTRVTRVGRFLRRWSIDELPQLINVIKGAMSLVGPRPHALPHEDQFALLTKNYAARRKMKPGMTGLAQIAGFRGAVHAPSDIEERLRLDLDYIARWSLSLDLYVLVATIRAVIWGKGAY
ncbi:MAG: exopolysaccharide biosynthesis polyprenyl glycosylphosphotransferase [Alphaproteobacteria bacterium]|nr:exopolysaccharide biosynthesis polyprenyl glycosylphosphotransferase [Alphaproteobacteria bacterium]MBU0796819.1 exopolysaccharide biosynthesis polyprenyl glycosylphosphotransferase [Alphaproteobacteria bacterium]MBU0885823.1 exopolysaccharide biosynthesis polyprenyl glycosylphosphotransferase [Alphaproteobacteria bacterium]MBU1812100.1 exopolysaccharide biosynthesis polyprenyl glycosylphosphotransferase [Alphaproteobacteria bacterium]